MKQLLLLLTLTASSCFAQFEPDILGENYEMLHFDCQDDYEGKVIGTVIRHKKNISEKKAVLYIHGYDDYFFQTNLADKVTDNDFAFYAVDLRKFGRSHLENQRWFEFRDVSEYYEDLDSAINIMERNGITDIYINAHSTGGLIAACYLNNRKSDQRIKGVIYNSPFFDINANWFSQKMIVPLVVKKGKKEPSKIYVQDTNQVYTYSIAKQYYGEWDYSMVYKSKDQAVNYGWLYAVYSAQKSLRKSSNIEIPQVVFSSNKSTRLKKWDDRAHFTDVVLNVKDIQRVGKKLGCCVKLIEINGGKHDLALSKKAARENYLNTFIEELKRISTKKQKS